MNKKGREQGCSKNVSSMQPRIWVNSQGYKEAGSELAAFGESPYYLLDPLDVRL